MTRNILVLGAGSWGTTLACLLAEKGFQVKLWEFNPELAAQLNATRRLPVLPDVAIPKNIAINASIEKLIEADQAIVIAVPSQFFRSSIRLLKKAVSSVTQPVISVTKGIENENLQRMSEIIIAEMPQAKEYVAVLSGPSHAEEVCRRIPTAVVTAAFKGKIARQVQELFSTPYFRVYSHHDIIGVELGGALKNIYALGAGIADGLNLGDNTKAALVTRGIAEMTRLGVQLGAEERTFAGLSGIGDIIVTCFSRHSRNRLLGEKIGAGKSIEQALSEMTMVVEGYPTVKSAYLLGQKLRSELPIINQIYSAFYEETDPSEAINALMTRAMKQEVETINSYTLPTK